MRTSLIAAVAILLSAACADAPITAADLQADGQLRQTASEQQQSIHAASETHQPKAQRAERLRVTGLVAAQADGPLEDATRFSLASEAIYLHLRVDDLTEPRPVTFVWTHFNHGFSDGSEQRRETMGFLQPAETVSLAATLPLTRVLEMGLEPGQEPDPLAAAGKWQVQVYSTDANGGSLLFERDFEVIEVEAYEKIEAMEQAGAAGVSN